MAGKVSKSDAAGGLNAQSKNQRLGQLMDHVEQRARDTDGNYAAGYQNERVREYAADVIAKNSDDYPDAERVARVLDILGGGQWDFFLLLRQRLTALGQSNPGHLPDVIRNAGFTPAQLNDLKNYLIGNDSRLLAFHNNLFRNSPNAQTNNMVTAYKYLLDKQLPTEQLLDVQRLGRWCDDMDNRPAMRAFLEAAPNNEGFTKWAALNHVSTPSEKALVEWIEGLWSSSHPGVDVTLPAAGKTNIRYLDNRVAEINAAGAMDIGPNVHNFGSANVDGSEIRVISPDGSSALVHRQGTGSKILRCACFPAGTPVHTPKGTVPIERLQPDDEIMAYDTQKKDTVVSQVRQVARKTWYNLMRIVTPGDTLWATGNHPFYIPALQQYLPADSLRRGMQLLALTGALLTVQSVAAVDTTVSVYNFEVADHHNYYVGEEGVLVHNTNGTCPLWVAILRKNKPDGGVIDATEGILDILQTQALRADIVQAFVDGNVDFIRFFTNGLDINNPADLVVAQGRVRAWGALREAPSLRTNIDYLKSVSGDLASLGYTVDDVIAHGVHATTAISDGVLKNNSTIYGLFRNLIDQDQLTWVEASSLFRYTYYDPIANVSGSGLVNPVLPSFPERIAAGRIIDRALQRLGQAGYYLPTGTITTRGGCYTPERMMADFQVPYINNEPTTLPVVLSSSTDASGQVAKKFIDRTYDGDNIRTIISITTKEGVYVDDFAHWGSNFNSTTNRGIAAEPDLPHPQFEVLQRPGKQYRIVRIQDDYDSVWYPGELLRRIELEEL